MAVLFIPSLLRPITDGADRVRVDAANLRGAIDALDAAHPGTRARLLDDRGELREGIVAAIDGETTHLGMIQPLRADSEVHFIPAVSGGSVRLR
jgi:molybdopterin converting factor small subunit